MRSVSVWATLLFAVNALWGQEVTRQEVDKLKQQIERLQEKVKEVDKLKTELEGFKAREKEKEAFESLPDKSIPEAKSDEGIVPKMVLREEFGDEEEEENRFYAQENTLPNVGLLEQGTQKLSNGALTVGGFITLLYSETYNGNSSLRHLPGQQSKPTFANSNIDLYFDAKVLHDFRFFLELKFLYEPYTFVIDYPLQERSSGEVLIERAWGEWNFRDWLHLRLGNILVPYGIWNLEHGDPILIHPLVPLLIQAKIFPDRVAGAQVWGIFAIDDFEFTYYAWVGNGKGTRFATQDDKHNKAVGARVEVKFPDYGPFYNILLGISGYVGEVKPQNSNDPRGLGEFDQLIAEEGISDMPAKWLAAGVDPGGRPLADYRDYAVGFDWRWRLAAFLFQSEFILNHVRPRESALITVAPDTYAEVKARPFRQYAGYFLGGYEIPSSWGMLTPFVRLDWIEYNDRVKKELNTFMGYDFGLNWKVNDYVVLKAVGSFVKVLGSRKRDFSWWAVTATISF
jgi:hypothetical protein